MGCQASQNAAATNGDKSGAALCGDVDLRGFLLAVARRATVARRFHKTAPP
jgi:hypothetical protein